MCTSTLSGWTLHPLQSLCICSLQNEGHRELHLQLEPQLRNAESTRERWKEVTRMPRILPRITEGRVQLVTLLSVSGLGWNLTESEESFEILITPSLLPLLQQKPNALCFECLVATSLYLIPWVYKCLPACTCPWALPSPPNSPPTPTPPSSTVTHPTDGLFTWWWSLWTCFHFFL